MMKNLQLRYTYRTVLYDDALLKRPMPCLMVSYSTVYSCKFFTIHNIA